MKTNKWLTFLIITCLFLATGLFSCSDHTLPGSVSFGVCTDVHNDLIPDGVARLTAFIEEMNRSDVDFIIQLGDFCRPYPANDTFLSTWNSFEGPAYHVLGNHDMDGGFTREETVAYWGMVNRYYSFDSRGFHFVVLDGNDQSGPVPADTSGSTEEVKHSWPPQGGYPHYIGDQQRKWLISDLSSTDLPSVIFSHQSFQDMWGVGNAGEIRSILEDMKQSNGKQKVLACFNGHTHIDTAVRVHDIWYVEINSMSYVWVGEQCQHLSYGNEVHERYPYVKYMCPYADPLWAVVTIERNGTIRLDGRKTTYVGPSPNEVGYAQKQYMEAVKPEIASRVLK